ncbi:ATP-dependent protease ATPase subunit HslU [Bienertia sinuspersici]
MEAKLTNWSAENATKAYLKTLKMGIKRPSEPDVSEFISAIAAGNDAQLMVVVCGGDTCPNTLLALEAAAYQTGGHVVCIFPSLNDLQSTKQALSENTTDLIEFVVGDAERLILEEYKEADLVLNDCKVNNHEAILRVVVQSIGKKCIVLGCNAFCSSSWDWAGVRTQLLPIGEGLLVTKIAGVSQRERGRGSGGGRKSNWVVRVDQHTGEEHVFRVRCPNNGMEIEH